ncbi:MAG: hypothetical protein A7316_08575 [Candidatus Altiarchaeales archaeon WOR_SM1_86-2]|nr:MAG: hypothetical protein A7316_08575 [Candidatus Altiarchaeales archaeon WOR_SM1_86-2]
MKIAILGPKGTFTEIAAREMFAREDFLFCDTIDDVFSAIEEDNADLGIVPVENSLEGSVSVTMDCLLLYDIKICREIDLGINLCLMVRRGAERDSIMTIISHPHALAQSRVFLKKNFPYARLERSESTAFAMKKTSEAKEGYAAIGPKSSADLYGLDVMEENIQDMPSETRFIVLSKPEKEISGGKPVNKTSIIFALKDAPGALYDALKEFAERGINLTKIESRPSKRRLGEYLFFVDLEGHLNDGNVKDALGEIKNKITFLKLLGSY